MENTTPVTTVVTENPQPVDNSSSNLIIAFLTIFLLALAGFLGYMLFAASSEDNNDNTQDMDTDDSNTDNQNVDTDTDLLPDDSSNDTENGNNTDNDSTESSVEVITITGMTFPSETVIAPGTTVRWVNNSMDHNINFTTIDVNSGIFSSGETFEHTFNEVGEFSYRCEIHPTMTGKIIVEE